MSKQLLDLTKEIRNLSEKEIRNLSEKEQTIYNKYGYYIPEQREQLVKLA